jgi:peptide chain release factor 3
MHKACWIKSSSEAALDELRSRRKNNLATDKDGKLVYLAESAWTLKMAQDNHPDIEFLTSSEF